VKRTLTLLLITLTLGAGGCMPWVMGETAETLGPGRIGAGIGAAGLAPPVLPKEGLAVIQGWVGVGTLDLLDVRADYVAPATFHAGLKARLFQSRGWAAAATGGLGYHRIPDFRGYRIGFSTRFATGGLIVSRRHEAFRPYAAARAIVPYVGGDYPGATLWWSGVAGVELGRGALRYGPELGFFVPTSHKSDWLVQLAFSVRRR
jgi:hypothetical protein